MKTISVERTASKGIVIGKAYIVKKQSLRAPETYIAESEIPHEIRRYDDAVHQAKTDLESLAEKSDIFAAHYELVQDIVLRDGVVDKIQSEKKNAALALKETIAGFILLFEAMEEEDMRERAIDMRDVGNRLLRALLYVQDTGLEDIYEESIIVANDLTPSDTTMLNLDYILGFITESGGVTSHVSIMAKNLGLPTLVGVSDILSEVKTGDVLIMDAGRGEIIINPDEDVIAVYEKKAEESQRKQSVLNEQACLPPVTLDGKQVAFCANVGNIDEIKHALKNHIDGIGLFRSENLYMENTHFPTEEEQFEVYKEAAQLLSGKEVTIRTLDIGGDEGLPYFAFEREENPFLGYRAIRICLDLEEVFKVQLRAILRASAYGFIRIMYPMMVSLEELDKANAILGICKTELRREEIPFDTNIKVGIMIETPAAILSLNDFARRVDFFSIGTNDLTQYLLAVDRGNQKISHLFDAFHPAVLRAVKQTIDAGHANHIKVGMCGELAGDIKALELLLGMGLDEFSMSAGSIPEIKHKLRQSDYQKAAALAAEILELPSVTKIKERLDVLL